MTEHWSDGAVHNEPAMPAGECDCGGLRIGDTVTFSSRPRWWRRALLWVGIIKPKPPNRFIVTSVMH